MSVYAARRLGLLLTLLAVFAFWILRIVKDPGAASNDFIWITRNNEAFELKTTKGKYGPIKGHIKRAVLKARKNHGVVKDRFVIDLGEQHLDAKVRRQLSEYNQRVEEAQIRRLIVLHSDGKKLEEIVLK